MSRVCSTPVSRLLIITTLALLSELVALRCDDQKNFSPPPPLEERKPRCVTCWLWNLTILKFSCIYCHGVTGINQESGTILCKYLSTGSLGKFLRSFGLTLSQTKKCGDMHQGNQWQCHSNCGNGSGSDIRLGGIPLPQRTRLWVGTLQGQRRRGRPRKSRNSG